MPTTKIVRCICIASACPRLRTATNWRGGMEPTRRSMPASRPVTPRVGRLEAHKTGLGGGTRRRRLAWAGARVARRSELERAARIGEVARAHVVVQQARCGDSGDVAVGALGLVRPPTRYGPEGPHLVAVVAEAVFRERPLIRIRLACSDPKKRLTLGILRSLQCQRVALAAPRVAEDGVLMVKPLDGALLRSTGVSANSIFSPARCRSRWSSQ